MKGGIEFGREAIGVASNAIHILHSGSHALASGLEGAGQLSDVNAWKMKAMACCVERRIRCPMRSSTLLSPIFRTRETIISRRSNFSRR